MTLFEKNDIIFFNMFLFCLSYKKNDSLFYLKKAIELNRNDISYYILLVEEFTNDYELNEYLIEEIYQVFE